MRLWELEGDLTKSQGKVSKGDLTTTTTRTT